MSEIDREHEAITAQNALHEIVSNWPRLQVLLANDSSGMGSEPLTGSREMPLPINAGAYETIRAVETWVWGLAGELRDTKTGFSVPRGTETDVMLATIASNRIGHWTANEDELVRAEFLADVERLRRRVHGTCWSERVRNIPTTMQCADVDEDGRPCLGEYHMRMDPNVPHIAHDATTWHDFVCLIAVEGRSTPVPTGHTATHREWNFAVASVDPRGELGPQERVRRIREELIRGRRVAA